jgi:hypothetical protein
MPKISSVSVASRLLLGFILVMTLVVAAFGLAELAIGPAPKAPVSTMSGRSRPAGQNWRTHTGLVEGISVAGVLGFDFARAWFSLTSWTWRAAAGSVATGTLVGGLLARRWLTSRRTPLAVPV